MSHSQQPACPKLFARNAHTNISFKCMYACLEGCTHTNTQTFVNIFYSTGEKQEQLRKMENTAQKLPKHTSTYRTHICATPMHSMNTFFL